jgi:hypothetical protein
METEDDNHDDDGDFWTVITALQEHLARARFLLEWTRAQDARDWRNSNEIQ